MSDKTLLTVAQVAQQIGCSASSVRRAAERLGLGQKITPRLIVIAYSDVDAIKADIKPTSGNPNWIPKQ